MGKSMAGEVCPHSPMMSLTPCTATAARKTMISAWAARVIFRLAPSGSLSTNMVTPMCLPFPMAYPAPRKVTQTIMYLADSSDQARGSWRTKRKNTAAKAITPMAPMSRATVQKANQSNHLRTCFKTFILTPLPAKKPGRKQPPPPRKGRYFMASAIFASDAATASRTSFTHCSPAWDLTYSSTGGWETDRNSSICSAVGT
jgi:hypothetical protein